MLSTREIVAAVRDVVGPGAVNLHDPSIGAAEAESVAKCVAAGAVGYSFVDPFQTKVAEACGTEQAVVTSSGTAALHLALIVLGVKPYDEVLVPALTFVGTANAVSYCGAIPNFVDIRSTDLGINPFKLGQYLGRIAERRDGGTFNRQSGRPIRALIAVDLLGYPCDADAILEVCGRWGLPMVEDAAQALGGAYKGRPCGSLGHIGVVSFNNNKIVTTNGGGALLTNDPFMAAKAWTLATTARLAHPWRMEHSEVAWNYRMGNINAALGLPQIKRLDDLIEQKNRVHGAYAKTLPVDVERELSPGSMSNHWLNAMTLPPLDHRRDEILAALTSDGIAARALFAPLNDLPMYKTSPRDNLGVAIDVWRRTICLPSSPKLGERL